MSISKMESADQDAAGGETLEDGSLLMGAEPAEPPKSLVPTKYNTPTKSGITVDVKSGMEPVKIELSSK